MPVFLHTLPVDLVYGIFDHLSDQDLFISISNICKRLNQIQNSYHRFQVSRQYSNEQFHIGHII